MKQKDKIFKLEFRQSQWASIQSALEDVFERESGLYTVQHHYPIYQKIQVALKKAEKTAKWTCQAQMPWGQFGLKRKNGVAI